MREIELIKRDSGRESGWRRGEGALGAGGLWHDLRGGERQDGDLEAAEKWKRADPGEQRAVDRRGGEPKLGRTRAGRSPRVEGPAAAEVGRRGRWTLDSEQCDESAASGAACGLRRVAAGRWSSTSQVRWRSRSGTRG